MWLITDIRLHIILIAASYRQTASRKQLTDVGPIGLTARCSITFVDGWRSTLSLDITWTPDYMHHVILQTKTVTWTKCSLQYEHTHTKKKQNFHVRSVFANLLNSTCAQVVTPSAELLFDFSARCTGANADMSVPLLAYKVYTLVTAEHTCGTLVLVARKLGHKNYTLTHWLLLSYPVILLTYAEPVYSQVLQLLMYDGVYCRSTTYEIRDILSIDVYCSHCVKMELISVL